MPRDRRHLLCTALAAFALLAGGGVAAPDASAAAADEFAVGSPSFQRALDVAHAHWGAIPCRGEVTYRWAGLEPLTNARATWSNPTDAWANAGANFACDVVFNALTHYDFPMFCTVLTHEVGHLLGHPHDADGGRLMSAIYTAPIPACEGAAPAPPAPAPGPAAEPAADEDRGIAWNVSDERAAAPKKQASKAAKRANKLRAKARRKRCFVRMKAGRRVRRCVPLERAGRKQRASRKARAAGHRRTPRYSAA